MTPQAATDERPFASTNPISPSHWKRRIAFSLALPIVCFAAYHLGTVAALNLRQSNQPAPLPTVNGLFVDPQSLDLGEIWESPQHEIRLTIRNVGNAPRTIERFQTTCSCLELLPQSKTLAPGEEAEFTGKIDLLRPLTGQLTAATRPLSVRLDPVFAQGAVATLGWEITGVIRNRVTLENPFLAFDRCTYNGPPMTRKVRARSHVPLQAIRASAEPAIADVRVEPNAASPGDYSIFVSPHPSLPVGTFAFDVNLRAVTMDGVSHPSPKIYASGEMQPAALVFPKMVLLGERNVGSSAVADVTLRLPAKDWKIDHLEAGTTETHVTQEKSISDVEIPLHVKQRITQVGNRSTTLRIVMRKPDQKQETVSVEIRYYGQ